MIDYVESHIIYENPKPHVHSRHGYFPGLTVLGSGEILAMFMVAEAFEAPNGTTYVTRSTDGGRTWRLEGPVYDKRVVGHETTDVMKPTLLSGGRLIAIGYRYDRYDPEQGIGVEETGGLLPGDDIVCFSEDDGKTWSVPAVIPRSRPELIEISGPCVELRSGELAAVGALLKMPDGGTPSGQQGVFLRSSDGGRTWDDRTVYFRAPGGNLTPYESRLAEMPDGRLVALVWAYDTSRNEHHPNMVVVSRDSGCTWSAPIDTGVMAQASNLVPLGDDLLLTIHAHRGDDPAIRVLIVDCARDRWRVVEEKAIWGAGVGPQTRAGQNMAAMFTSLKFGQPSLVHLGGGEYLAAHWSVEDGQGKIRAHRLMVR
ncbi:MAG: glycoside hydrolase [Acidobacteriales bacterium]|nr:glycoside hydrolase [Terriglobales bacterium]